MSHFPGRKGAGVDREGLREMLTRMDLPDDMRLTAGLALAAAKDPAALTRVWRVS